MLGGIVSPILDAVFPNACPGCGELSGSGGGLCEACSERIAKFVEAPYCHRCGRTAAAVTISEDGCRGCASERMWTMGEVLRVGPYEEPLRKLILAVKYGHDRRAPELLAELLADRLRGATWFGEVDALVPVPMHLLRRAQRPRNHALVIARLVGRRLKIPVSRALVRSRYRPSQTEYTSRTRRIENVRDCFEAAPRRIWRLIPPVINGRTLCLIDNLADSGGTLHECAKVLRKSGAKRVYVLVVARATPAGDFQPGIDAVMSGAAGGTRDFA